MSNVSKRNQRQDQIYGAATRLFGDLGFNGVSTRAIAREVGLNIATVNYHVGSKRELYAEVVRRLYQHEQELLDRHLNEIAEDVLTDPRAFVELLGAVIEALVNMQAEHPERARLYMQRWLEPRDDLSDIEARYSLALHSRLRDLLERARDGGAVRTNLDIGMFLRSFAWMLFGYFVTGPIDWRDWFADPLAPEAIAELKSYLVDYAQRMVANEAKGA